MERRSKIAFIVGFVCLVLHIYLNWRMMNGTILRIQGWIDLSIVMILFWLFWLAISVAIMWMDIGFMKFAAAIGVFTGVLAFVYLSVWNTTDYELLREGDHEIVVRFDDGPNNRMISIYERDGLLFSEYYEEAWIAAHFTVTYEIIDDDFVIYRCATASCTTEEIPLD